MTILVVGSCQAKAISYNLSLIFPNHKHQFIELNETKLGFGEIRELINNSLVAVCFALDDERFAEIRCAELQHCDNVILIPRVYFKGFHTDFEYISVAGRPAPSEVMLYHAMLACSCALMGRSEEETLRLYNDRVYLNSRHSDLYVLSLATLKEKEALSHLSVSDILSAGDRVRQPMFTFNHPSEDVLRQWVVRIAGAIIDRFHLKADWDRFDALFVGYFGVDIVLPVLPGIESNKFPYLKRTDAVRLGVDGSYRHVSLRELISTEYRFIAALDDSVKDELRQRDVVSYYISTLS